MMYIHSNNETDKRINVSKIANNISTVGDNSSAARCNSSLITVLVQHAHDIVYKRTLVSVTMCLRVYVPSVL